MLYQKITSFIKCLVVSATMKSMMTMNLLVISKNLLMQNVNMTRSKGLLKKSDKQDMAWLSLEERILNLASLKSLNKAEDLESKSVPQHQAFTLCALMCRQRLLQSLAQKIKVKILQKILWINLRPILQPFGIQTSWVEAFTV